MALLLLSGCGPSSNSGAGGAPAAPTDTAVPAGGSGGSGSGGAPFPTPQEETYQGCPPQGDGGDGQLNVLKNRIDTGAWQTTTVQNILSLSWPPGVPKTRRSTWSSADAAAVAQNEGRPVIAEGYILMIRHEGPESPNCHDASQRDYHVWLAASASDTRASSVVVELTPRVVARNPGWGAETNLLRLRGHHVRVAGWLLLDQEHPEQLQKTRGTLWEIHPVIQVEVDQAGTWANLASGTVSLGNAPVSSGTGTYGRTRRHYGGSTRSHHRSHHRQSSST